MIHISYKNTKMGKIPSISLPPHETCPSDAPCCNRKLCYAQKGRFQMRRVQDALWANYNEYLGHTSEYFSEIASVASLYSYFRWHTAGDIPDFTYLIGMVSVARQVPGTKFLVFTKQYDIVNRLWASGDVSFPNNLIIVFSDWNGYIGDKNPFKFPTSHVLLPDKTPAECKIPEDAHGCMGKCDECVATPGIVSCWHLQCGESVYFKFH